MLLTQARDLGLAPDRVGARAALGLGRGQVLDRAGLPFCSGAGAKGFGPLASALVRS